MSTTGQETADSEELRRKQKMANARLNYNSHNLKLRLQYARLKVDHGWQRQTLSEVENLYFRHSVPSTSEHHPVTSSSTTPPNSPSTPSLSSSDSFGGLTRSDTLQTIPDSSVISTAQLSFQSITASGSFDVPRIPIPPSLESYMAATMSPPRPSHDASMECRAMSPPCSSTLVRPPPHPQLRLADPNIDPSLVSVPATPLTHPPPPKPPLSTSPVHPTHHFIPPVRPPLNPLTSTASLSATATATASQTNTTNTTCSSHLPPTPRTVHAGRKETVPPDPTRPHETLAPHVRLLLELPPELRPARKRHRGMSDTLSGVWTPQTSLRGGRCRRGE
ncbi:hypothetical protein BXZ70DRAFT_1067222 [Cristinia sonorae]|uniref:Uncharacterized protein n=1 Tax=Cristinia sonorae TaxID=1940300 RepID=A0A8K0UIG4_9AGAR|nr:hypothetical protein BXZ70DRAFT_1067222 [Cristinia sonorae]